MFVPPYIHSSLARTKQVGNIVTQEEIARFSMHAFRHHGQAMFADAVANLDREKPDIGDRELPGEKLVQCLDKWAEHLPNAAVTGEPLFRHKLDQMVQELAPNYERLKDIAERWAQAG